MCAFPFVTAAATEVTVSAAVETMKIDELPTPHATVALDTRYPADLPHLQSGIAEAPETTVPADDDAKPVPGADFTSAVRESDSVPQKAPDAVKAHDVVAPAAVEVVEGEVMTASEEQNSEDVLGDGTTVRKKVVTLRHVQPVTTISRKVDRTEERVTDEKLIGTEVDEHVLVMEPGTMQVRFYELENETRVNEFEEALADGSWLKRKVTTVTVKRPKTPETQPVAGKPSATEPPERHEEVDSDRKPDDDQTKTLPSKPSVVPVKLTKLEPLMKDGANVPADSAVHKATSSTDPDAAKSQHQTASGSPSVSVVRLTKLEPLPLNGNTVGDPSLVKPTAKTTDSTEPLRAPASPAEQKPAAVQSPPEHATIQTAPLPDGTQT